MIKKVLIFSLLAAILSCSSVKRVEKSCRENPFEELDSLQRANQKLNYTIDKPKDWKRGKTSNGDWYFLEGKYIDSLNYYSRKVDVYIGLHKIRKECTTKSFSIDDYLHYFVNYRSKWFPKDKFKYLLLKGKHKIYGTIYIVKYTEKINTKISYTRSFFLFFKDNKGYNIQYVTKPKLYDTYLPEVEKMVNSFRMLD